MAPTFIFLAPLVVAGEDLEGCVICVVELDAGERVPFVLKRVGQNHIPIQYWETDVYTARSKARKTSWSAVVDMII